jgi:hypothetical protein
MNPSQRQLSGYGWRPADPPRRPLLFVNPRSGDGTAARAGIAERARANGIFEAVILAPGQDLAALVRDAVAAGADALGMAWQDSSAGHRSARLPCSTSSCGPCHPTDWLPAPAQSCYQMTHQPGGPVTFVLSARGHIACMGVHGQRADRPAAPFRTIPVDPAGPDEPLAPPATVGQLATGPLARAGRAQQRALCAPVDARRGYLYGAVRGAGNLYVPDR